MNKPQSSRKSRRQFLKTGIKAGALAPLMASPILSTASSLFSPKKKPLHPLKILILGGTSFLGPHQIAYALSRGHSISIFTRGKTKPTVNKEAFKHVEHLVGDRNDNLEALKGRKWDAVIYNSGHRTQWTKDTAELLKDNVDLYMYTSSVSAYYPFRKPDLKEDAKVVLEVPDGVEGEEKMEYDYGVMKATSEVEAIKAFGKDRTIVVRPTYIVGPGDGSDRFTYWPVRLSMGGEIMVPGKANDPVQYIDVRDLANWMIRLIENRSTGTFNGVGPIAPMTLHPFIYGAHAAFSTAADFVMIPDYEFLTKNEVFYIVPWVMPTGDNATLALVNNQKALSTGMTFTPLADTVRDTYEWWSSDALTDERRARLTSGAKSIMAREKEIIAAWRKK